MSGTRDGIASVPLLWTGKNESGWSPLDDKVLVMPDEIVTKTVGGITLTDETLEKHAYSIEYGVLVEAGPAAFAMSGDRVRHWELTDAANPKPQPGDRVFFQRYAGQLLKGEDGKTYRLMDDRAIGGVKKRG